MRFRYHLANHDVTLFLRMENGIMCWFNQYWPHNENQIALYIFITVVHQLSGIHIWRNCKAVNCSFGLFPSSGILENIKHELALSKGPKWVGVFPPCLRTETDSVSKTSCIFFLEYHMMKKSKNPVILCYIPSSEPFRIYSKLLFWKLLSNSMFHFVIHNDVQKMLWSLWPWDYRTNHTFCNFFTNFMI
jgi:hypothetical protein